ncbi:MBL fold metallo-hydrolase [Blastopirellula sp. JC732]|uniref:MBL fold metallo-hydrolase n=1 Tax=Blastopirellula sediminis TaxID=2894196 RepID=A0A9X1SE25_9BACT|nr:MBL fold metallo-hydrolase [Blastopirellula sediminis]MCC9607912.1 MBL fold metallo-hydrolase [Blastopirellula sediminis]MCC9627295.1 MBL fold metallo-hydrolase [Blastopirellula sediminis]
MKLQVFQSDKGDCLLITSVDGKRVLVDGGMSSSYKEHVAPALGKLQQAGHRLDAVYVSHIDQDHIAGVLKMTDDLIAWRIYDFQSQNGNAHVKKPKVPRPPDFDRVWNNAFHEQLGKNAGSIEDMLAARARALTLIPKKFAQEAAEEYAEIAFSKGEAVRLSRRLGNKQLNVAVNPEFDHGLMFVCDPPDPLTIGKLNFTVIGPFAEDLKNLRTEWNAWLRTQTAKDQLAGIRRKSKQDEDRLGNSDLHEVLGPIFAQASELGNRENVTLPNLASLMFHLEEENGGTVLLTGDGHWQDILDGLEETGKLVSGKGLHVNVLKVQHHGSEHNWHADFGKRITADHYIFCGNGAHENPDLDVVQALLDSRIGSASKRSKNPEVGNPFKLWFNSAASIAEPAHKSHMKKLEKLLNDTQSSHPGQISSFFLTKSSFELDI